MQTIASFTVNHDVLEKGLYVSRIDGDVVTFDLRMKKPNGGDYLPVGAMHTLEHLLATYLRNSAYSNAVIYTGPMGCRTGFYLLFRDSVSKDEVLQMVQQALQFVARFEGEIPGSKRWGCGNYLEHDLPGAKAVAADMLQVLQNWTQEKMQYAQ